MTPENEQELFRQVADIDKRVAVLERRADEGKEGMTKMENHLLDIRKTLGRHVEQEQQDRIKLLLMVLGTLLTAVATLIGFALQFWLNNH